MFKFNEIFAKAEMKTRATGSQAAKYWAQPLQLIRQRSLDTALEWMDAGGRVGASGSGWTG